jgi:hypothetical protein
MEGDEKGVKDDICRDINDCDTIPFEDCIKCDKMDGYDGYLVSHHCSDSKNATKIQCLDHDFTNDFPLVDIKDSFCRYNNNATYNDCQSVNYEQVYCYNNSYKKGEDINKCKDYLINSDYCTGNNMANYKDCCSSATGNILNDYITNYKTPIPFDTPKIKISLPTKDRGSGGITKRACTLRENCKNIEVTPDNVYPVRRLCSDITIGYDKDSKKYDFSDSICKKINELVKQKFNDKHLAYPKKDDQEDDLKKDGLVGKIDEDGVYTFNDNLGNEHIYNYHSDYYTSYNETIKKKIKQNGYENLIREYCHCWNNDPKPEICKLFF